MKLKSQKNFGIFNIIFGAALEVLFLILQNFDYKGGVLCGLGSSFIVIGLLYLLRYRRLSKNAEKAADYDASVTDERTAFIVSKARSVTFYICIFAQLIAGLVCMLFLDQRAIGEVLTFLTCFQCLLYYVILVILNRKY